MLMIVVGGVLGHVVPLDTAVPVVYVFALFIGAALSMWAFGAVRGEVPLMVLLHVFFQVSLGTP